ELTPASLLLAGRLVRAVAGCGWWIVILDSAGEEAELLETVLDIPVDFHHGIFPAQDLKSAHLADQDELEQLIEQFREAIRTGSLADLAARYATIPAPTTIARQAREQWLQVEGLASFDPWAIAEPGDAIMKISREIE